MKRTGRRVVSGLGVVLAAASACLWSQAHGQDADGADANTVYELRTYTTHPGRLDALHRRFREHTMKLFEKHGMENVIYWTPLKEDGSPSEDTLVYVLRHKSLDDAKRSWQAFRQDPQWQEARRKSEEDGPIVKNVTAQFLKPTEFSPRP